MPLISRYVTPPGGFQYYEPSINWRAPDPMLPFDMVAGQISMARAQNKQAGLNPEFTACANALDAYTCARLNNDPRWCTTVALSQSSQQPTVRRACCGGRKRR